MSAPIKTSYDSIILAMAAEGALSTEIVAATGKPLNQIYNRAIQLGVSRILVRNRKARSLAKKALRPSATVGIRRPRKSALALSLISPARVDRSATDLTNALRAARRTGAPLATVPGSFIARVFEAGLTLDDIDAELGVPPADAVAAIRHHLEVRP